MRFRFHNRYAPVLLAGVAIALASSQDASAHRYKLRTLHSFCAESGCADGQEPSVGLIQDSSGNFFGTTLFGGANGQGTLFELVANAHKTRCKYKVIHDFCALPGCADGHEPDASLIMDTAGNLLGTTMTSGANNGGTVYELMPNARKTKWTLVVRHSFCAASACADGRESQASLNYEGKATGALYGGTSPLYGTTFQGGANNQGAVFQLTPVAGTGPWNEQVLYSFCPVSGCADGASPAAAVTLDTKGNIFGTTYYGGQNNQGTVFELSPTPGKSKPPTLAETVLHSFCSSANCSDGSFPAAEMRIDASGNLFGTSYGGGQKSRHCVETGVNGCGVAFKLAPNGAASQETVLYRFCSRNNCIDGGYPLAGMIMDETGTLYGAGLYGGGNGTSPGGGAVFTLKGAEQALYRFCALPDCADGRLPEGDLVRDGSGNLFGTTLFDGANGDGGTVFELVP